MKRCGDSRRIAEDARMAELNEMDVDHRGDDDDDDDDNDENENGDEDVLTMTAVAADEDEEMMPDGDVDVTIKPEETLETSYEQASYECKNCEPPKTLPNVEAYFEHLRKQHKQKVRMPFSHTDLLSRVFALSCPFSLFLLCFLSHCCFFSNG